jgi:hypothetical protein
MQVSHVPEWFPQWLKTAMAEPVMSVPDAGRAVFGTEPQRSYALAREGRIPTIRGIKRVTVPTIWVRQKLLIDEAGAAPARPARRRLNRP